jgi:hypothetical protein
VPVYLYRSGEWKRNVIEDAMLNGQALGTGDLNSGGRDEIADFNGDGPAIACSGASTGNVKLYSLLPASGPR